MGNSSPSNNSACNGGTDDQKRDSVRPAKYTSQTKLSKSNFKPNESPISAASHGSSTIMTEHSSRSKSPPSPRSIHQTQSKYQSMGYRNGMCVFFALNVYLTRYRCETACNL